MQTASSADGGPEEDIEGALSSTRNVSFGRRVVQPVPSSCASTNAKHVLSGARTVGLNRQEKAAKVEEVSALVASAQTIVVAEYRGLDVDSATKLRKQARSQGVQLRVLKNTLARRAMSGTAFAGLSDKLVGPLVYGFSADPVAAAKVLSSFAKDNDKLVVKAGAMANFVMDEKGVKALATMPSREELLARLMATMQAPIAQFVRTLNEVPSRLVRTLAAVRDAKETAAA
jgi:large subunit ribosomal protein L10